jgi:hypothetical protein
MEEIKQETCSSDTSVDFKRTTRRYIPELIITAAVNLKSHIFTYVVYYTFNKYTEKQVTFNSILAISSMFNSHALPLTKSGLIKKHVT